MIDPNNAIKISNNNFWMKVLENHQQNWAIIESQKSKQRVIIYFIHDGSGVFDKIELHTLEEAINALRKNGFHLFSEDKTAQEFLRPPEPPYDIGKHPNGNIYSSGRFWIGDTGNKFINTGNIMDKDKLDKQIKKCNKCSGMNIKGITENAPGYGDINSPIVFIGQSLCGDKCIKRQRPFVGGAGILLDNAFKKSEIKKSDIYITNIVKCHPPENRQSKPEEIRKCIPFLNEELC